MRAQRDKESEDRRAQEKADMLKAEQTKNSQTILYIVLGNFIIIILGGITVFIVKRRS